MARRVLVLIVAAGVLSPAFAASGPGRDGPFLMLSGQSLDFNRDLDRNLTLWHFEKAFFIPRLEKGLAWSAAYGRKSYNGAWDISYLRASRTVAIEGESRRATYHALDLSGRSYFLKKHAFRPYFLGGITIPVIRVKGGSVYEGKTLNATYAGAGLNAGVGIHYDVGPGVFLNAAVTYRWVGFLYAFGEGKGRDINDLRVGYLGPEFGRLLRTDVLCLALGVGFIL